VGDEGKVIGIYQFGASGPSDRLLKEFGFTIENIVTIALEMVEGSH
jgi:transketolase